MSVGKFKIEGVPKATGVVLFDDTGAVEAREYLRLKNHLRVAHIYYGHGGEPYVRGFSRKMGDVREGWSGVGRIGIFFSQNENLNEPTFDQFLACYHPSTHFVYPDVNVSSLTFTRDRVQRLCRFFVQRRHQRDARKAKRILKKKGSLAFRAYCEEVGLDAEE